jgi:hypothetical protein
MTKILSVKQPEPPIPTEVMADSIVAIAKAMWTLRSGRLNDNALYLLIQNAAPKIGGKYSKKPVPITTIKAVFDGIASLEATYLKKGAK